MQSLTKWIDRHAPVLLDVFGAKHSRCLAPYRDLQDSIRRHQSALNDILHHAESSDKGGGLKEVQTRLRDLPPLIRGPLRILVVMAVGGADNEIQMKNLKQWMRTLKTYDFFVYSYACATKKDLDKHRGVLRDVPNLVQLHHKVGTGCKLDFWVHAMQAIRKPSYPTQYTHVWFVDNDLDMRHFDKRAFEALVKHNAPLVCQPGILRRTHRDRGSDHPLCEAQFHHQCSRAKAFDSFAYDFRGRRLRDPYQSTHNSYQWTLFGLEVMCPLMDCRILDAFLKIVAEFDARSDWACERVFNQLSTEFAAFSASQNAPRVSKLVLDFVPLIHMDTRSINKHSVCQRKDLNEVHIQTICKYLAQHQERCHAWKWVSQAHECQI